MAKFYLKKIQTGMFSWSDKIPAFSIWIKLTKFKEKLKENDEWKQLEMKIESKTYRKEIIIRQNTETGAHILSYQYSFIWEGVLASYTVVILHGGKVEKSKLGTSISQAGR